MDRWNLLSSLLLDRVSPLGDHAHLSITSSNFAHNAALNSTNQISISCLNCHGAKTSIVYINELIASNQVLFLSEHWLLELEKSAIDDSSTHTLVFSPGSKKERGRPFGGNAFFVSNELKFELVQDFGFGILISIETSGVKIFLCGVYLKFCSYKNKSEYADQLNLLSGFMETYSTGDNFLFMGDWNSSPLTEPSRGANPNLFSPMLSEFTTSFYLKSFDLSQGSGSEYTYHNSISKSYIDHFIGHSNFCMEIVSCEVNPPNMDNFSDHLSLSMKMLVPCKPSGDSSNTDSSNTFSKFWHFQDGIQIFNEQVNPSVSQTDGSISFIEIVRILKEASVKACMGKPQRKHHRTGQKWWSTELDKLRDKVRKYHDLIKRKTKVEFNPSAVYALARREYKRAIRNAKNVELNKKHVNFDRLRTKQPRTFWRQMKSTKKAGSYSINGAKSKEAIASGFMKHFSKILTDKNDYSESEFQARVNDFAESISSNTGGFDPIKIEIKQIRDGISKLKTGKACGPDGIFAEMLRYCDNDQLLKSLRDLYSNILNTGVVPPGMMQANMIPVVKNAKKGYNGPNNYRPISLISIFGKLFELIVITICPILKDSSSLQHGFKSNESTMHAGYTVRSTIEHYLKSGNELYACTLDAVKAFDLVSWYGLFSKLIPILPPLIWLALFNYYKGSSFAIVYENVSSAFSSVSCGVKQGGILSPHLYSLYINELLISLHDSPYGTWIKSTFTGAVVYADDILLLSATPHGMQELISICYHYGLKWKITFNPNPEKSDIICFNGKFSGDDPPRFYLGNSEIKMTTSFTHLGFIWDSTDTTLLLSHAENRIMSFVQQGYNLINRGIRRSHPRSIATVIKVQLFPLLYGIELGSFSRYQVSIWQTKINAIVKSLFSCSKYCSNVLFRTFDIMSLQDFWTFKNSVMCHQICSNDYTNSILSYRVLNHENTVCKSFLAMTGVKIKPEVNQDADGLIDSLRGLVNTWIDKQSQHQFRDILHYHCSGRYLPP